MVERFGWGVSLGAPAPALAEIREAYEDSYTDNEGAGDVGLAEHTDPDLGGDGGELSETAEDAVPGEPADYSAEPVGDDSALGGAGAYPGVMISGDPLKAAQMEATWRVGELEAEKVGEYDLPENARRLAELRSLALAAKEGAAPDLTEAQKEELHALETFDGWLSRIRTYADNLRDAIRKVESADALAWINLEQGWPE